jgi:hypothetical protein
MKGGDYGALETAKLLNDPFMTPTVPGEDRFNCLQYPGKRRHRRLSRCISKERECCKASKYARM